MWSCESCSTTPTAEPPEHPDAPSCVFLAFLACFFENQLEVRSFSSAAIRTDFHCQLQRSRTNFLSKKCKILLFLICHEVRSCRRATYPGALPAHKTLTLRVPARTGRSKYDAAARFASSIVSKLLRSKFERRRRGTTHAPRAPPSDQPAVGRHFTDHWACRHQLLLMKKAKTRLCDVPAREGKKVTCCLTGIRTRNL